MTKIRRTKGRYNDVRFVQTRLRDYFQPIAQRENVTDQEIGRGQPHFFAIVMGDEKQFWAIVTAFMEFVVSQPTEQFSRECSFVLVPRRKRPRLTKVVWIVEKRDRATLGEVDQ
jgi:hypothetical protein